MLRPSSTHAQCRPHRSSLRQRTMSALDTTSARHRARHTPPSSNHRTPATSHFTAVIALRHYVVSIKDGTGASSPHPPPSPRAHHPSLYPPNAISLPFAWSERGRRNDHVRKWEGKSEISRGKLTISYPPPLLLRAHVACRPPEPLQQISYLIFNIPGISMPSAWNPSQQARRSIACNFRDGTILP